MITLHSITKFKGHGRSRRLVLDDVDWVLQPRTHYVILGQRGSGKSTLLSIISGQETPTKGWIERRGIVSSPSNFRIAKPLMTVSQLVRDVALIFRTDRSQLAQFVEQFADLKGGMDTPIRLLLPVPRQKLNLALFYGIRSDFYLFDGRLDSRLPGIREKIEIALDARKKESGIILVTSHPHAAHGLSAVTGLLFRGQLRFFETFEKAVEVFERLPVESDDIQRERAGPKDLLDSTQGHLSEEP